MTSTSHIDLSIILPVFNPEKDWANQILAKYKKVQELHPTLVIELILSNDGSTNENYRIELALLQNLPFITIVSSPINKGKGYALRAGMSAAKGKWMVYTDIDFPYTMESLDAVLVPILAGSTDVCIGVKDKLYYENVPVIRKYISKSLRFLIRTLLQVPTDDTQCGLKAFNEVGKEIFLSTQINRYLFDLEFVYLCNQKNIRFAMQTVKLRDGVVFRKMNYKIILAEGVNFLKIMFR